jgi:hypothetical protein
MDAKDILGLPKNSLPQEKKPRPQKDSQRKPDGISREVCYEYVQIRICMCVCAHVCLLYVFMCNLSIFASFGEFSL